MKIKTKNLSSIDMEEISEYEEHNLKTKTFMDNQGSARQFKNDISVSKFTCNTANQKEIVKSINDKGNTITIVHGKPGTGKTYSAIQGALKAFKNGSYTKLYLSKSVKTLDNKSEDIGFLKGSLEEKIAPFMFSYDFNFKQIISPTVYDAARQAQTIEFLPLAYIRGIGLNNCVIILDEAQNINNAILRTVLSRIGKNCKLIILGDTQQKDSSTGQTSGLDFLIKNFQDIKGFNVIEMTKEDQSRADIINNIEDRYDELEAQGKKVA
jgi:phosphate starvation-inducible PhoH-like protein